MDPFWFLLGSFFVPFLILFGSFLDTFWFLSGYLLGTFMPIFLVRANIWHTVIKKIRINKFENYCLSEAMSSVEYEREYRQK